MFEKISNNVRIVFVGSMTERISTFLQRILRK